MIYYCLNKISRILLQLFYIYLNIKDKVKQRHQCRKEKNTTLFRTITYLYGENLLFLCGY